MRAKTTLPVTTARKRIFSIIDEIQGKADCYTLTERGIPKAVIISAEKFEKLNSKKGKGFFLADKSRANYGVSFFPKTLVIRDDSRVVYLSDSGQEENLKSREQDFIKAQLYVELIEKYKIPLRLIELGRYVKIGPKEGRHYVEADIIVNDECGNARLIFEVGGFDKFKENADRIISDLFSLADALSWSRKPDYLIYYSRKFNPARTPRL